MDDTAAAWRQEEHDRRIEERSWRKIEVDFKGVQKLVMNEERQYRILKRRWHKEDVWQRNLEHSRYLWSRLKEVNRREVEEKAEHMRSMSWLAALIAGFTMTAPVEFDYNTSNPPKALVTAYAIFTAAVPGLMTVAAMVCVYLLGAVLKMGNGFVSEEAEEEYMARCRLFATLQRPQNCPPAPRRTFDRFWDMRCEDDWRWTFRLFCWGVTFFFCLLGTMAFLKFDPNDWIPSVFASILLIFGLYWVWIQYQWGRYLTSRPKTHSSSDPSSPSHVARTKPTGDPFDWHLRPSCSSHDLHSSMLWTASDASSMDGGSSSFVGSRGLSAVRSSQLQEVRESELSEMEVGSRMPLSS